MSETNDSKQANQTTNKNMEIYISSALLPAKQHFQWLR